MSGGHCVVGRGETIERGLSHHVTSFVMACHVRAGRRKGFEFIERVQAREITRPSASFRLPLCWHISPFAPRRSGVVFYLLSHF